MIRSQHFIKRKIGNQDVIVAIGAATKRFNGMISVNGSGSMIWDRLEQDATVEDLVALITESYDVDAETARSDIHDFLTNLKEVGAIEGY